ncbi:MAG: hypothetical protein LBF92_06670, partial [Synergistaceae bacterium]|nr:hypothetical protein [Synergistaceae bacterium]
GTEIPLSNLNDNPTAAGSYSGAPNTYYFDRASGQIILYVTPEVIGEYRCNVYYKGAAALNVHPITLNVRRTTNYYYTEKSGGGCDAGAAAWIAAMSAAAAFLLCRPRRKR